MTDQTASFSDELDLFAIVHTLWNRKALVLLFACVGLILGLGGSFVLPINHKISVPASINYHSLKSGNLCPDLRTIQRCLTQIDFSFAPGFSALSQKYQHVELRGSLSAEQSAGTVRIHLEELIKVQSLQMYEEATEYLDYVKSLGVNKIATEAITKELLKAHFIVSQHQKGIPFATLGAASVSSTRPPAPIIAALVAICMSLLACVFVLVKTAHSNWKRNQPN